ncbi:flagellar motor switch protein FliM [Salmonella enterica]|nr:flagellar motor switch protein FliM [Salmonella enterica]EJH1054367.1 flagellar motor switch protein FliM [Salmonella enterica]
MSDEKTSSLDEISDLSEYYDDKIGAGTDSEVRPYDPHVQRRVINERLSTLEFINERFARQFRIGAFNILHRSLDVTAGNIRIQPYHEFARSLPAMTNLNLVYMTPLRGTALFVFSPNLIFTFVDILFGGNGVLNARAENKAFTPTEQRIIQRMLSVALEAYDYAWSSTFSLKTEYIRSELLVKFTNITSSPNDIVITTPFYIELGSEHTELTICIPFGVIEPLRELLTNPPQENERAQDNEWNGSLISQIRDAELELVANFVDIPMRLSQVMNLKPQDILFLEKPNFLTAVVDGVPVLSGTYGRAGKQYALRVESLYDSALQSLNKDGSHE